MKKNKTKESDELESEDTAPIKSKFQQVEEFLGLRYDFRYNEVSNSVEIKEKNDITFSEANENNIYRLLQHRNIGFSLSNLTALLRSDFIKPYNPLDHYFTGLPKWCGEPDYIEETANYVHARDQIRFNRHFRKMLVRTIACALNPAYFNKHAFILFGQKHNSGKSTFCRWLCPPALLTYQTENISQDKDGLIALSENLIINLDELAVFSKMEINQLKSMLSKDKVKIRKPFDKKPLLTPRRASFVGSTNDRFFLTDPTGSVRWLIFEIDAIDWKYATNVKIDQLWSQAYSLFTEGFQYELTSAEIADNEHSNEGHQKLSAEFELIQKYYTPGTKSDHTEFLSLTDIESRIQSNEPKLKIIRENLSKALIQIGFEPMQSRNPRRNYPYRGYYVKEITESSDNNAATTTTTDSNPLPF
jgi:predicted P-loop ATPase